MSNNRVTSTNCNKKVKTAQAFGQYGTTAAGTTGFALDVMGLCVPIPMPIKIGIAAFIGLLFGCFGGCNEYKKGDVDERQDRDIEEIRHYLHLNEKEDNAQSFLLFSPRGVQSHSPADMKMERDEWTFEGDRPVSLERKPSIRL